MKSNQKQTLLVLSKNPKYQAFFRLKWKNRFHIVPLSDTNSIVDDVSLIPCDFLIIDDTLFGKKIYSLLCDFRNKSQLSPIPILVITHSLKKKHIQLLIQAGANEILYEPIEEEDLEKRFKEAEKYRSMQQKLDHIIGNLSTHAKTSYSLEGRMLLDKLSIKNIEISLLKKIPISLVLLEAKQPEMIDNSLQQELLQKLSKIIDENDYIINLGHGKFILFFQKKPDKETFLIAKRFLSEVSLKQNSLSQPVAFVAGMTTTQIVKYRDISSMMRDAKRALIGAKQEGSSFAIFQP